MKTRKTSLLPRLLLLSSLLAAAGISNAQTPVSAGAVNGTWGVNGSPYLIMGEIHILSGESLHIEAGVTVEFQGHYKFLVQGSLIAEGTYYDTIYFTIYDSTGWHNINTTDGGWHGIRFGYGGPSTDSSRLRYCVFAFGKASSTQYMDQSGGAIAVHQYDDLVVSNSNFYMNAALDAGGAVAISSAGITLEMNSYFHNMATNGGAIATYNSSSRIAKSYLVDNHASNSGGGISLYSNSSDEITANLFAGNFADFGGAVQVETNCSPVIRNNLMYSNVAYEEGGGLDIEGNCQVTLINNTIADNFALFGGGLDVEVNCSPVLRNCILWGNTAFVDGPQVHLFSEDSDPDFYYCDIEGGMDSIGTWYGGSTYLTYEGIYENNIDQDPDFTNMGILYYLLNDGSPCIDSGDPDPAYNDLEDPEHPGYALFPSKGTLRNDIGCWGGPFVWYYDITTSLDEYAGRQQPGQAIKDLHCFPNPCSHVGHISFENKIEQHITIELVSLNGKITDRLFEGIRAPGKQDITFFAGHLSHGIYFVVIRAKDEIFLDKIVVSK